MPFQNANVTAGIAANDKFQVGVSDVDTGAIVEQGVGIPWASDPAASWVYYDCNISTMLDSGIVVHNQLPQVNRSADTLASCNLDDQNLEQIIGPGVNLNCKDDYEDIVQRMGHARYLFRIWGQALRLGYRIPIPGIKTIGGVPAIPYDQNPQFAFNRIAPGGNYSGVILWHAQWSLWYTTIKPPINQTIPAADPFAHINGSTQPPKQQQAPYSVPDSNAVKSGPQAVVKLSNLK